MKVALINPSFGGRVSRGRYNRAWPPLDLLNLAAIFEAAGHRAELFDLRAKTWSNDQIYSSTSKADLIIITTSPLDRWQCPNIGLDPVLDLCGRLPVDRLHLTGVHGSLFPDQTLARIKAAGLILGQPEAAAVDLAAGLEPGAVRGLVLADGTSGPPPEALGWEDLPPPAYHLISPADYGYELLGPRLALIEGGRGCPHQCAFCLQAMYRPGRKRRPPEAVVDEAARLSRDWGARSVYFIDLEFTLDSAWAAAVAQGLIDRGLKLGWCCQTRADAVDGPLLELMAQSGCRLIHYGVESGSAATMARSGKRLDLQAVAQAMALTRRAGITSAGFFMLGLPGEGPAEAQETIDLARRLAPDFASFSLYLPYPGTAWGGDLASPEDWEAAAAGQEQRWGAIARRAYQGYYLSPLRALRLARALGLRQLAAGAGLWLDFIGRRR